MNEEISVEIDQGKTLLIKMIAVSPVNAVTGMREVLMELNGEVRLPLRAWFSRKSNLVLTMPFERTQARLMQIEDKNAAIDTVRRERASKEPGSVGSPMTAVVVNVMVQEGHEVKAGDP